MSLTWIILEIQSEKVCSQVMLSESSWQRFCRDKGQSHEDTLSLPGYRSHRVGCHQWEWPVPAEGTQGCHHSSPFLEGKEPVGHLVSQTKSNCWSGKQAWLYLQFRHPVCYSHLYFPSCLVIPQTHQHLWIWFCHIHIFFESGAWIQVLEQLEWPCWRKCLEKVLTSWQIHQLKSIVKKNSDNMFIMYVTILWVFLVHLQELSRLTFCMSNLHSSITEKLLPCKL